MVSRASFRSSFGALAGAFMLLCAPGTATAQAAWPTKPITVIVPYTPGGSVDSSTRMIMEKVSVALGQPIVIENRPGANTTLATGMVARAKPDGHTFGVVPATYTANYAMFSSLPYKAASFTPVSHLVDIPMFLFTRSETPVSTVKELEALLRSKPATYASTGAGSTGHFLGAMFAQVTGLEAAHVPYNGSAPILADLMSGQIDFSFDPAAVPMPHAKAGRLKVLAVSLPKRCACEPSVPTMEESGYKGFVQSSWTGLMAPAGLPADVVDRMSQAITQAVATPEIAQRLQAMGMQGVGGSPSEFQTLIERDTSTYAEIARRADIKIQ